jgi:hypothetical protein
MPIIWHRINLLHWLLNADYQVAPKWRLATACYQLVLLLFGIDWQLNGGLDGFKCCCLLLGHPEP